MKTPEEFIEDFDDGAFEVPEEMLEAEERAECRHNGSCPTPVRCYLDGKCGKLK